MQLIDESAAAPGGFEVLVVDVSAGTVQVSVRGDLDLATAERLRAALFAMLEVYRPRCLELTMRQLTFIDASGVAALFAVCLTAGKLDCTVRLSQLPRHIRRVLDLTGLLALCQESA